MSCHAEHLFLRVEYCKHASSLPRKKVGLRKNMSDHLNELHRGSVDAKPCIDFAHKRDEIQ